MRGTAALRVSRADGPANRMDNGVDRGRVVIDEMRSTPQLVLRPVGGAVHMVGGAAGPLGGDDLRLVVEVGAGAGLTLRSAAATVARRGADGGPSRLQVDAQVAAGGWVRWLPEPTVVTYGAHHLVEVRLSMMPGASAVWREEVVLGRTGEKPGRFGSRLDVTVGGVPILRQHLGLGPGARGAEGPAVTAGARVIATTVLIGAAGEAAVLDDEAGRAVAMALPRNAGMAVTALAAEHRHARRLTAELCGRLVLPPCPAEAG